MTMKVIATRGPEAFLISIKPQRARIYDAELHTLGPEMNLQSILARGYWREYTDSQDEILQQVKNLK